MVAKSIIDKISIFLSLLYVQVSVATPSDNHIIYDLKPDVILHHAIVHLVSRAAATW